MSNKAETTFFSNIVLRTTLIILTTGIVCSVLLAIMSTRIVTQHEELRLKEGIFELMLAVERTASIAAFTHDSQLADEVAQGLILNRGVAGVSIASSSEILVTAGAEKNSNKLINVIKQPLYSPFDSTEEIGAITLIPAYELLAEDAASFSRFIVLILISIILIFIITIIYTVTKFVTHPIRSLSISLNKINFNQGEKLLFTGSKRRDEIGKLSNDINQMLDRVNSLLLKERLLKEEHARSERKWRLIFDTAQTGIFTLNLNGNLEDCNPWFANTFGLVGINIKNQTINLNTLCKLEKPIFDSLIKELLETQLPTQMEFYITTNSSNRRWMNMTLSLMKNNKVQGVMNDITTNKLSEEKALADAQIDKLTNLYNRRGLEHLSEKILNQSSAVGIAILLVDLDGFKPINDTYGHDSGDEVLIHVSRQLESSVRTNDLVARLGGDEFVILLSDIISSEKAERIAEKLVNLIGKPFSLQTGKTVSVSASIGIAYSEAGNQNLAELLKNADIAMYEAKHQGKATFVLRKITDTIIVKTPKSAPDDF